MAYKSKLKSILLEEKALQEKKQKLLHSVILRQTIILYRIPKTEKEISKYVKQASGNDKCSLLDLEIIDFFDNKVFIFGEKRAIFCNLKRIAERIKIGKECKIGNIGLGFSSLGRSQLASEVLSGLMKLEK